MELSELIDSIDIVDYISQFTELKERNGEFWGLSPLKEEKTPSFSIRRETKSFYDFSSGLAGNVFSFTRFYYHCSGQEAIEILKKYAGIDGELDKPREKMAATVTCKKFSNKNRPQKDACDDVGKIYPQDYMKRYDRDLSKMKTWTDEGISLESLDKFEVRYDKFSNRLVYPIRNLSGDIVNIGGRTLNPNYKESGIRKYTYFSQWGSMNLVYGLFDNLESILDAHEMIIFEGCKSVLLADTWGIHNTGALLTSHLSSNQLKILAGLGVRVVFALDKDVNIREDHHIKVLKNYINTEYLCDIHDLLDAKDSPVDKGKDVFMQLYNSRFRFR